MADLASRYLSALEGGKGFGGAAKEAGAGIKKDVTRAYGKERVVRTMVSGDDILSAYIRGKLGVKKKPEKEKTPSKIGGVEGEGGFSSEGAAFLKIIAKNSMSLPGMARDMNVLRQNVVKLVKLKGGKARGAADAYFLKEDERERALEAQKLKVGGKPSPAGSPKEKEGGLLDSIIGMFSGGFMDAIKSLFNPKMLMKVFTKVFLPLAIIGTLFSGIMDGFKRYQETGSFSEAIVAGLGGMLKFITFGIFGEDTLKSLFESISNFFSPITDTISNIFNGIKDFFKGLFGIKTEDEGPKDIAKVKPEMPDAGKFASGAAKASGASDEKAADIGGLFGAVGKGDVQGLFGKAQEFAKKYPETPATETSPTQMSSEGVPLDQAQRNYELNKKLTGEASKALGIPLEAPASPSAASPTPQSPVATAPTPTPEMSDGDKIKQLEGYIESNKTRFAKREADAARHIASFKKRYANDPDRVKQLEEDYASTLAVEKKEMEQANAGFQSQIDALKKSSKGAVAAASGSSPSVESGGSGGGVAPASGVSGGGGGSGAGGAMAEASGGSSPSGNEMSQASSQIAEGQRMESAADQGSVVNAPTTNNQMGGGGGSKPQVADVYNSDLASMLMRT
jgi:uncharacterized membrane protein YgcG